MAEVLSQEEIRKLLSAVSQDHEGADHQNNEAQEKIIFYNFNRPHVFSESRQNTLSYMHGQLARSVTNSFTSLFHTRTAFHVAGVCELTCEEFSRSVPNPSFLCTISLSPFPYSCVIEIDPPLISAIIDLLAGGDGSNISICGNREISELDILILSGFLPAIISPFSDMWNTKIAISPGVEKIESNPSRMAVTSPRAMVILITIESLIGGAEGMVNICYPVNFIRIPFMEEEIKKNITINQNLMKMKKIICKKYNQYRIGNFSIGDLKKFKLGKEIIIGRDTLCDQKYTPVIRNKEE